MRIAWAIQGRVTLSQIIVVLEWCGGTANDSLHLWIATLKPLFQHSSPPVYSHFFLPFQTSLGRTLKVGGNEERRSLWEWKRCSTFSLRSPQRLLNHHSPPKNYLQFCLWKKANNIWPCADVTKGKQNEYKNKAQTDYAFLLENIWVQTFVSLLVILEGWWDYGYQFWLGKFLEAWGSCLKRVMEWQGAC